MEHGTPAPASVTFAVIGRNEAATLRTSLEQALAAAEPGDRVLFVDGGSSDESLSIAREMGVEGVEAGAGKGRAIAVAAEAAGPAALCTIDADIEWSEVNIPATLRAAYVRTRADMVVANFVQKARARTIIPGVYHPFVAALFPEALHVGGPTPITGFRIMAPGLTTNAVPAGYGVETYLNIRFALDGRQIERLDIGLYDGPLKGYANIERMAADVIATILDLAVAERRLHPSMRGAYEEWASAVVEHASSLPVPPEGRETYTARLMELAARPLPVAQPAGAAP
ncbi:MAG: glycosyltransferase [Thermoleophilaceae bacterium]